MFWELWIYNECWYTSSLCYLSLFLSGPEISLGVLSFNLCLYLLVTHEEDPGVAG